MSTKLRLVFSITIAFLSFYGSAQTGYWKHEVSQQNLSKNFSERFDVQKGQVFSFNEQLFKNELKNESTEKVVSFPNEKGVLVAFKVKEQSVFSPGLSRKYPDIKSYSGYALNGSNDKIRFSVSHKGIQSMIVHADKRGATFMQKDANNSYVLYSRDPNSRRNKEFICSTEPAIESKVGNRFLQPIDQQVLRKYRLAVAATGEYTEFHGGTVADALAAINATVTRINEVFETDLAIQLELVANTDQVIFTDPDNDPYIGTSSSQVQAEFTNTIGEANYDIGILFSKAQEDGNAGGIGTVCDDGRKGRAYARSNIPEGDTFDLDYVAHEMGHQFGANHTWSHMPEGTGVQFEPGSGTTIMGYAGITGPNNVAQNGDDYFHYISIVQIIEYLGTTSCGETMALTNNPPTISPAGNFTIPISTPFVLEGQASDLDTDDVLTYVWEQIDDGVVTTDTFGPTNLFGANFRSLKPSEDPKRYFPKLSSVIAGNLEQTNPTITSSWETVSAVEREMNFALTVRDNGIGGGQVASDLVNVFVENSAGPFVVTSQDTDVITLAGGSEEVLWDVANTDMAPINAQTVDIFLSLDGGVTFDTVLAENIINDGSYTIQLPLVSSTTARLMVKAHDNIFYAVNASDFTIEESEIALNFAALEHDICVPDILVVPFSYETNGSFDEEATFSIVAPPAGVDIAIFPETATADDTPVDITFSNTQGLAVGAYPIRVLASTASLSKEITLTLNVYDTNFSAVALTSPSDSEIDVSTGILLEWEENESATSYGVEIASDAAFATIIESGSTFRNSYRPLNLENLNTYFWRVQPKNACGEGTFSEASSFTTVAFNCQTEEAIDLPATISASGTPVVTSKIEVFDDLRIADVNVTFELDHSFISDLVITLTSPMGTVVVLTSNSCDESDNINATFDDDALGNFVCGETPAISGTVKPLGSLSSFKGESTLGEWVLTVSDNSPSDGGTLKTFSIEICAEGEFKTDDDNDGVFDDGTDLCLGTPAGTPVDASGCPVLLVQPSNYKVESRSESCRSSNDGIITVNVESTFDYTAVLTGTGVNSTTDFTAPELTFNNLSAGSYSLCITATDGTLVSREQCFDIVIDEPELLSVSSKTSLDGSVVDLELIGASSFNIELNGVTFQIEDSTARLNLKPGLNTLKVITNLPCQGTHEEQFLYSNEPFVYPNPFEDKIKVFFGTTVDAVKVQVFDANGRFIFRREFLANATELEMDFSALSTGMYFIQFETEKISGTSKIIKR